MKNQREYSKFLSKVCELSDCSRTDIKTKSRKREIVRARQIIISYRHTILGLTQEKATAPFRMNHSSVGHAIKVVKNDYQRDKNYKSTFSEIFEKYPSLIE